MGGNHSTLGKCKKRRSGGGTAPGTTFVFLHPGAVLGCNQGIFPRGKKEETCAENRGENERKKKTQIKRGTDPQHDSSLSAGASGVLSRRLGRYGLQEGLGEGLARSLREPFPLLEGADRGGARSVVNPKKLALGRGHRQSEKKESEYVPRPSYFKSGTQGWA